MREYVHYKSSVFIQYRTSFARRDRGCGHHASVKLQVFQKGFLHLFYALIVKPFRVTVWEFSKLMKPR